MLMLYKFVFLLPFNQKAIEFKLTAVDKIYYYAKCTIFLWVVVILFTTIFFISFKYNKIPCENTTT